MQLMKDTKESWVADEPENTDLAIYLHFWRGDDLAAMIQTPLDRDTGLAAGRVAASGFGATAMSITFESYYSNLGESPVTGERWEPREMQYVFEAVAENRTEHWVKECLTTTAHDRGGEYGLISLPYVIEDKTKVIWSDEKQTVSSNIEGEAGGGVMFEYLQDVMQQPTIEEVIGQQDSELIDLMNSLVDDPEARQFHTDMATLAALEERQLVTAAMFSAEPGSNRAKWIEERLGPRAIRVTDI